jgi:protein-S-isoprenylcysteine O-methyltransferase Ste14
VNVRFRHFFTGGGLWAILQILILLAVVVLGPIWPGHDRWIPNGTVGRILLLLSAAMALTGFLTLGSNLSPHPKPRPQATLVQHGIYAWVRHPLYTSLMIGSIGWACLWQSAPALVAALVLVVILDTKARVEERWLQNQFPAYADYARRVRRFLPWIY